MSSGKIKRSYDAHSNQYHEMLLDDRRNFWNKYLDEYWCFKLLKGHVNGKRVLDLGCGSGIRTARMAKMGAEVVGIDFSKRLLKIARANNPKINFFAGDIRRMPFRSSEFDVINSNLVMHYFKDLRPVFKEASRILKKGGVFIFSMHHPVQDCKRKIHLNGRTEYVLTEYFHNNALHWKMLEGMELISYHHTFENIINTLSGAGFRIEKIVETKPPRFSRKSSVEAYDKTSKYPSFLVFKAIKV